MLAAPVFAQYNAPRLMNPAALDNLVNRIALYPDPLLAQVLAAATYTDQIQDAARFAYDNRGLRGEALANTISYSNLPFDPSVQALIPFPDVLDMMARDMNWTAALGDAVLEQRPDVMDAVQRMRRVAQGYGYLRTGPEVRVVSGPSYIEILPVSPSFIWVPVYDPYVVFAPPRPGFFVGAAIGFRTGFVVGAAFGGWGWGGGFNWHSHALIVNHAEWNRTWVNRTAYVHDHGNWNGGHWSHEPNRPVTINNFHVNNNVRVDRNTSESTRNSYRSSQTNNFAPSRGPERREPERGAAHEHREVRERGGRRDR